MRKLLPASLLCMSFLLLVLSASTIPYLGSAPADPLFPVKVMPLLYWLGFFSTIGVSLTIIVLYKGDYKKAYALTSLLLLTGYIYVLPKLMFSNAIWTDTHGFMGEVLHVLRFGYIGFQHAVETPGISTFAAQLSLITGVNHWIIAETFPFFLPFLVVILVYLFARIFCGERSSYLAVIAYLSLSWFGFYFNRHSFVMPLMFLSWYSIVKKFDSLEPRWAILTLTTFAAAVISHPGSSAAIALSIASLVIVLFLFKIPRKLGLAGGAVSKLEFGGKSVKSSVVMSAGILFVIWFAWQIYHFGTLHDVIEQTVVSINEFFSDPSPATQAAATVSRYTTEYLPVVWLRLLWMIFSVALGTVLAIIFYVTAKSKKKPLFLASMFLCIAALAVYVMYAHRWIDRPFFYSSFLAAVLMGWFIFDFKPKKFFSLEKLTTFFKACTVGIILLFTALVPLLMYSHMAFVYPPTPDLNVHEFLTKHGIGRTAIIGAHTDTDYYFFKNDASLNPLYYRRISNPEEFVTLEEGDYKIIVGTFRAYTKDAFVKYEPSLTRCMSQLKSKMSTELLYNKIYCADEWHEIYSRVSY